MHVTKNLKFTARDNAQFYDPGKKQEPMLDPDEGDSSQNIQSFFNLYDSHVWGLGAIKGGTFRGFQPLTPIIYFKFDIARR